MYASELIGVRGAISRLFAYAQAADQIGVPIGILALQVIQEPAALPDKLEETASRVVVLRVGLEVLGEVSDSFAENGDLNFRRSGVGVVRTVRSDELGFAVFVKCH
jgi:hypothetical protein